MQALRDIFRSDAFVPTTAVFPAIDADQIARELKIEALGAERGARNEPRADEDGLDVVERRILERVGELRRKGIDNYALNRSLYDKRLTRAGEARKEAEFVAGKARGDFQAAVKIWKARMATPMTRVSEVHRGLHAFRKRHGLEDRPVHDPASPWRWAFVLLLLLIVESVLNAGFFARQNALGLTGGAMTAFLVSALNVGPASFAAYFGRNVNHRNWLRKLLGVMAVGAGIAWAGGFNLAVAHFRDALERQPDWEIASRDAWARMITSPLAIESVMSALLVSIGLVVSLLAALKTYHALDPYPGYARVEATVGRAREVYAADLTSAIENLDRARDEAIDTLQDVNTQMRLAINEAIDALYGASSLSKELGRFLTHSDAQAQLLLETYRDANRRARPRAGEQGVAAAPPPPHFDRVYSFPAFEEDGAAAPRRDEAVLERDQVGDLVSRAIAEIFAEYQASIAAYPDIHVLESRLETAHAEALHEGGAATTSRRDDAARHAGREGRVAVLPRSSSRETT